MPDTKVKHSTVKLVMFFLINTPIVSLIIDFIPTLLLEGQDLPILFFTIFKV